MSQRIFGIPKTFNGSVRCSSLRDNVFLKYECPVQNNIGKIFATVRNKAHAR
jgi:hypothetical protein